MRFEDNNVCRSNEGEHKSFNLGAVIDRVTYSSTNSRFERRFVSLEDKTREKRAFSKLDVS